MPGRRLLFVLAVVIMAPAVLYGTVALMLAVDQRGLGIQADLRHQALTVGAAVDRMLGEQIAALTVLASSPELDVGDTAAFDIRARRAVATHGTWLNLVLVDHDGQRVNTRLPRGAPLPAPNPPEYAGRVFETGRPLVSPVVITPDRFVQPTVRIIVPVVREGTVRYVLGASMPTAVFHAVLEEEVERAPDRQVLLIDGHDRIIERSVVPDGPNRQVGSIVPAAFLGGLRRTSGVTETELPDGHRALMTEAAVPLADWRVVYSQTTDSLEAPLEMWRLTLTGGGLLALLLSSAGGVTLLRLSRRLSDAEGGQVAERHVAETAARLPALIHRHQQSPDGVVRLVAVVGALAPREGVSPLEDALRTAVAAPEPLRFDREERSPDGERHWLRSIVTAHRAPGGVVLWDGLTIDITDLRRTEARLRERECRLRTAQDAAGLGSWEWDLDSGTIVWSDGLYRLLGVEPGALQPNVASFVERFVHPDDRQTLLAALHRATLVGGAFRIEYRILRDDGAPRWLECSGGGVIDADGRTVRLLGILRDTTDRRAAEEKLHAANAALELEVAKHERTEALLHAVFAGSPLGMCVLDSKLRYLHINDRLAALNGLSPADHIGRSLRDVLPPAVVGIVEPVIRHALVTGERVDGLRLSGPPPLDLDATHHWCLHLQPLRLGDGGVYAVNVIVDDITEQVEADQGLHAALDEAREANTAKARFFAAASHDLRQPVQTLFLFAHALKERLQDHPAQPLLATLQQALEGLKVLIDTLLDMSRLDSGALAPEPTDFPAVTLLQRLAADYAPRMAAKGLRFHMVGSSRWIRSDPLLLGRILGNLLDNAVKYTDRGGVLIGCRLRGDRLWIEVWDTGAGIALNDQVAIFEEFVQVGTTPRDRRQGLGLGLSIVRRLAGLLGHELALRSRPGQGSVFAVGVPLAAETADSQRPPPLLVAAGSGGPPLAVVVDDDATILSALGMLLGEWGYDALTGATPDEALALIAEHRRRPAVIIADYQLPGGLTGIDAIRQIRAYCNAPVPAIVLTGDSGPERAAEVGRIGAHLLQKPVGPETLLELMRRIGRAPKV